MCNRLPMTMSGLGWGSAYVCDFEGLARAIVLDEHVQPTDARSPKKTWGSEVCKDWT